MLKTLSFSTRIACCISFTALALASATALSNSIWSSGTSLKRQSRKKRERPQLPVSRIIPSSKFKPDKCYTKGSSDTLRKMLVPVNLPSSDKRIQRAGLAPLYVEDDAYTSDDTVPPINLLPSDKGKQRAGSSRPIYTPPCKVCAHFSDARRNSIADMESEQNDGSLVSWDALTCTDNTYPPIPCTYNNKTVYPGLLMPPGISTYTDNTWPPLSNTCKINAVIPRLKQDAAIWGALNIPHCTNNTCQPVFSGTWDIGTVASKSRSKQGAEVSIPSGVPPSTNAYISGSSDIHIFNPFDPTPIQDTGVLTSLGLSGVPSYSTSLLTSINADVVNLGAQSNTNRREFHMALAGVAITQGKDSVQITIGLGGRDEGYLDDIRKIFSQSAFPFKLNITLQYGMWDIVEGHAVIQSIERIARDYPCSIISTAPYGVSLHKPLPDGTSFSSLPFRTSVWANNIIQPSLDSIDYTKLVSLTLNCSISVYDCLEIIYRARSLAEFEIRGSLGCCDSIMGHTFLQLDPTQDIISKIGTLFIVSFVDPRPLFDRVQFHKLTNLALMISGMPWPMDLRVPWSGLVKVALVGDLNPEASRDIRRACPDRTYHDHATLEGVILT